MIRNTLLVEVETTSTEVDNYGDPIPSDPEIITLRPLAVQPKKLTAGQEGQSVHSSEVYMAYFSSLFPRAYIDEELRRVELHQKVTWKQGTTVRGEFLVSAPPAFMEGSFTNDETVKFEITKVSGEDG